MLERQFIHYSAKPVWSLNLIQTDTAKKFLLQGDILDVSIPLIISIFWLLYHLFVQSEIFTLRQFITY